MVQQTIQDIIKFKTTFKNYQGKKVDKQLFEILQSS